MNEPFDIVVLVPTNRPWEPRSETARLISAALARVPGAKLLVVENGLAGEAPASREDGGALVLRLARGNKSAALNAGLERLTRETLLVFFDDDVLVPEGIVAAYAEAARSWGPGHYFGGPTTARFEVPATPAVARLLPDSARGLSYGDRPRTGSDFFLGFNWAAFLGDLRAIGGFDPRFGPGSSTGATGQETTAQRRLRSRGARSVYIPEARVTHMVPPERCSEAFVLSRARKNGVGLGLTAREDAVAALTLVPWRLARHAAGVLAAMLRPGELKLALACRSEFWSGFIKGARGAG